MHPGSGVGGGCYVGRVMVDGPWHIGGKGSEHQPGVTPAGAHSIPASLDVRPSEWALKMGEWKGTYEEGFGCLIYSEMGCVTWQYRRIVLP